MFAGLTKLVCMKQVQFNSRGFPAGFEKEAATAGDYPAGNGRRPVFGEVS
jgi:hypothetical protein